VKETGKKVLESVGGAAATVGHTAKQVRDDDVRTHISISGRSWLTYGPAQLWDGALTSVGARHGEHEHHGLVDKAKDVGKVRHPSRWCSS
jgi:hypothetical protein